MSERPNVELAVPVPLTLMVESSPVRGFILILRHVRYLPVCGAHMMPYHAPS